MRRLARPHLSSPRASSRGDGYRAEREKTSQAIAADAPWQALEEEMAMQVATLQHRRGAEQNDSERILRMSVSRLDTRVYGLENQSARSDRRSAELTGLAQALTQEQRSLLLRLDRLETAATTQTPLVPSAPATPAREPASTRDLGSSADELQRRLCHVEREQAAVSTNLRLIVSVVEEAQQHQQSRLRSLEERLVVAHGPPALSGPSPSDSRSGSSLAARATLASLPNDTLRVELGAAEVRASRSLKAAQDLLRRCERSSAPAKPGDPGESVTPRFRSPTRDLCDEFGVEDLRRRLHPATPGAPEDLGGGVGVASSKAFQAPHGAIQEMWLRLGELGEDLGPRADALEAKVQALADTVEELTARGAAPQQGVRAEGIDSTVRALSGSVEELRLRFQTVPTYDQVAALFRAENAEREGLKVRLESVEKMALVPEDTVAQISKELARRAHEQQVGLQQVEELRSRLDDMVCGQEVARTVAANEAAVSDLKLRVDSLPTQEQVERGLKALSQPALSSDIQELREKLQGMAKDMSEQLKGACRSREVSPTLRRVEAHESSLAELRSKLDKLPSHQQVILSCQEVCNSQSDVLEELRAQVRALGDAQTLAQVKAIGDAQGHNGMADMSRRVQEHSQAIAELHRQLQPCEAVDKAMKARLEKIEHAVQVASTSSATSEEVLQRRLLASHADDLAELRSQLAASDTAREQLLAHVRDTCLQDARSGPAGNLESIAALQTQVSELHLRLAAMPSPEYLESVRQQMTRERERGTAPQLEAFDALHARIEHLHGRVSEVLDSRSEVSSTLCELRSQIAELPKREQLLQIVHEQSCGSSHVVSANMSQVEKLDALHDRLEGLAAEVSGRATHADMLHSRVSELLSGHSASSTALAELTELLPDLTQLRAQVVAMPTVEQLLAAREHMVHPDSSLVDSLAVEVSNRATQAAENAAVLHSHVSGLVSSQAAATEALAELRTQLAAVPTTEQLLARVHEQLAMDPSRALAAQRLDALQASYGNLSLELQAIAAASSASRVECSGALEALRTQVQGLPKLEVLQTRLADLTHEVQAVGASSAEAATVLNQRLQEVLDNREKAEGHDAELETYIDALADTAPEQAYVDGALVEVSVEQECEAWNSIALSSQLVVGECSALNRRCDAMQEVMDERIMVSLHGMERQLPQTLSKVERLLAEQNERFSKVEENDVRLSVALTKLENCEKKVRDCMSRLDQVPTASHARALWQEELRKLMGEINVDGLSKRVDLTLESIEEIHQAQQKQAVELNSLARRLQEDEELGATYELRALTSATA